jgi:putative transcriptional regulator
MNEVVLKEALTASYAAGALDPALRLLMETQAAIRVTAKAELNAAEALAGALLERQPPAAMSPDALASVMAVIDAPAPMDSAEQLAARAAGGLIDEILRLPRPLHDVALNAIGHGGWMFAGPGLRTLALPIRSDSRTELLRIEPGWGAPRHTHTGLELTLIMTGAFKDSRGRFGPGEIVVSGPDITHNPVADKGDVCYALAVTEGKLSFTGAFGLFQRFWRQ